MKKTIVGEVRPLGDNLPIPPNRNESAMPSAVRDLAELLADIAVRQLRSNPITPQGEQLHE